MLTSQILKQLHHSTALQCSPPTALNTSGFLRAAHLVLDLYSPSCLVTQRPNHRASSGNQTEETAGSCGGKTQTLTVKWNHPPNLCPRTEIPSPKSPTDGPSHSIQGKLGETRRFDAGFFPITTYRQNRVPDTSVNSGHFY